MSSWQQKCVNHQWCLESIHTLLRIESVHTVLLSRSILLRGCDILCWESPMRMHSFIAKTMVSLDWKWLRLCLHSSKAMLRQCWDIAERLLRCEIFVCFSPRVPSKREENILKYTYKRRKNPNILHLKHYWDTTKTVITCCWDTVEPVLRHCWHIADTMS